MKGLSVIDNAKRLSLETTLIFYIYLRKLFKTKSLWNYRISYTSEKTIINGYL